LRSRRKIPGVILLLARLMGQYCFARWCLSSVVVCNPAGGRAGRPPGTWAVERPTLHGGPVRLRPVMATPCFTYSLSQKWKYAFLGLTSSCMIIVLNARLNSTSALTLAKVVSGIFY